MDLNNSKRLKGMKISKEIVRGRTEFRKLAQDFKDFQEKEKTI